MRVRERAPEEQKVTAVPENLGPLVRSYRGCPSPHIRDASIIETWERHGDSIPQLLIKIGNIKTAYHGTSADVVPAIASTRFRSGGTGMFGPGIYCAPSVEKAATYAVMRSDDTKFYVVECLVALGKPYRPQRTGSDIVKDMKMAGCDSIIANEGPLSGAWTGSLRNAEYVVTNPNQIMVYRIHLYKQHESKPLPSIYDRATHPCERDGRVCKNAVIHGGCILAEKVRDSKWCRSYEAGNLTPAHFAYRASTKRVGLVQPR